MKYPRQQIKKLNERLRKLEKVYFTDEGVSYAQAGKSDFYNYLVDQAVSNPNGMGKFLKLEMIGDEIKVRFVNATAFNQMSKEEQKGFMGLLGKAERSQTSTKTDIEEHTEKSRQAVYDRYPEYFEGLSDAEKAEKYEDVVAGIRNYWANQEDHMSYDKEAWDLLSTRTDITQFLVDNVETMGAKQAMTIFDEALQNAKKGQWDKIDKKYFVNF